MGERQIDRAQLEDAELDVPATVQTFVEFTSACPSTTTVMRKPPVTPRDSCL
jgi:hypothetical protein